MLKEVAVDNDYLVHLAEIDKWDAGILSQKSQLLFDGMGISPVMHELVYKNEVERGADIKSKSVVLALFSADVVKVKYLDDYLDCPQKRTYYEMLFRELYYDFRGDLPSEFDVLKDWHSKASLGETHSVVMCYFIDCGVFLSDDADSEALAKIIKLKKCFEIKIYDRKESINQYMKLGGTGLNKTDRKLIKHCIKGNSGSDYDK